VKPLDGALGATELVGDLSVRPLPLEVELDEMALVRLEGANGLAQHGDGVLVVLPCGEKLVALQGRRGQEHRGGEEDSAARRPARRLRAGIRGGRRGGIQTALGWGRLAAKRDIVVSVRSDCTRASRPSRRRRWPRTRGAAKASKGVPRAGSKRRAASIRAS